MNRHHLLPTRPIALGLALMACYATSAGADPSQLYPPSRNHEGTLRLAQVNAIATRGEILDAVPIHKALLAFNIPDSALHDGSLASGRTYCCGGPGEVRLSVFFYVPGDMHLERGDIVEIRMGRAPRKRDPGAINVALRVREKRSTETPVCRWMPPNERMWGRILYCDWMEAEGWVKTHGLWNTWLKRGAPADSLPQNASTTRAGQ